MKPIGTVARMWADNTYTKWSDSYLKMVYYTHLQMCKEGEYIHLTEGQCSWHVLGRNTLASEIQGDWLFMSDTDHCFAPDLLIRLHEIKKEVGAQVISAIYQRKSPPFGPVMGVWEGDTLLGVGDFPRDVNAFTIGAVGGGGLLIDREVFERITRELGEQPFDTIGGLSEDYSFCLRCKRLGIPVYVCPRVQTHHIIPHVLSINDYKPDHSNLIKTPSYSGQLITLQDNPEGSAVKLNKGVIL